jgi:glycosyltransferase involved in cell wall biosynthesis
MEKVAYITNAPPFSGMGKPTREIYSRLDKDRFDMDFFYLDGTKNELVKNNEMFSSISSLPKPFAAKPISWWRLAKSLPKKDYDLWHITNQTLSFIPRKDFLLTVYDLIELLDPQEKFGKYAAKFLYKGIPKAKHIICISEYTKKTLRESYGIADEKISVIPLGVNDTFIFNRDAKSSVGYFEFLRQYEIPAGAKIILYVGSDHPRKNLNGLAEIFAEVIKTVPNCFLVKVGDAGVRAGREQFLKKLDDLGVRKFVKFTGAISDEKLQMIYSLADVFVFPSFYEGFGVPPLEAMACGCPVVCSNATSLPEVMGDVGILLDPNDITEFAKSIIEILNNVELAEELRSGGLKHVKMFSWEDIVAKTEAIYERMLEK